MTQKPKISERHRRTRNDHAAETAEDYVEAISDVLNAKGECRVVDLAKRFDVSHVTVTKIVSRLIREGLVESEPYKPLELTPKGSRLAAKSRKRHEIVYDFLLAIGVDSVVAEIDAEGIEHHVSQQTLKCFQELTDKLKAVN